MTPAEVLDRFTEEEMVRLVAYQHLYGPLSPERLDLLFARLGMEVAAPHMKKGKRPRLKDHRMDWPRLLGRRSARKTPRQILAAIRGIQASYDRDAAVSSRKAARGARGQV